MSMCASRKKNLLSLATGASRFVIASVALSSCLLAFAGRKASAQTNFPYNAQYPNGLNNVAPDQNAANNKISADWNTFKTTLLTSNGAGSGGQRVLWGQDSVSGTVSEGQAYGMLFSVYLNDQTLFNQLYQYVKTHRNSNGMMWWHIDGNGNYTTVDYGNGGATDADEDIAAALCFAHKKWGSSGSVNYQSEATTLINNLMSTCVDSAGGLEGSSPTYTLLTGDGYHVAPLDFNPSYFSPAWYRIFKAVTGDARWDNVINQGYAILGRAAHPSTGLVPANCGTDGKTLQGRANYGWEYRYQYDAFRTPWRLGVDYSWNGNTSSQAFARKIGDYYAGFFTPSNPNLKAARYIDGSEPWDYESPEFTMGAASAQMTRGNSTDARNFYNVLAARNDTYYYGLSWKLFGELYITGNFPNLWGATASAGGGTVNSRLLGHTIGLKAVNGKFVQVQNGNGALIANGNAVGSWEKFIVVQDNWGYISLRSYSANKYLSANPNGSAVGSYAAQALGDWERFTISDSYGLPGKYVIRAKGADKLLMVQNGGNNPGSDTINANSGNPGTWVGTWESFELTDLG